MRRDIAPAKLDVLRDIGVHLSSQRYAVTRLWVASQISTGLDHTDLQPLPRLGIHSALRQLCRKYAARSPASYYDDVIVLHFRHRSPLELLRLHLRVFCLRFVDRIANRVIISLVARLNIEVAVSHHAIAIDHINSSLVKSPFRI